MKCNLWIKLRPIKSDISYGSDERRTFEIRLKGLAYCCNINSYVLFIVCLVASVTLIVINECDLALTYINPFPVEWFA